jgi:hypothetical protein
MSNELKFSPSHQIEATSFSMMQRLIELVDDRKGRKILTESELQKSFEFQAFCEMIKKKGQPVYEYDHHAIVSVKASDFETVSQKIGFALLTNLFFNTDMGLPGVGIVFCQEC